MSACKQCNGKKIVIVEVKAPSSEDQGTYEVQQCAQCDALPDNREAAKALRAAGYVLFADGEGGAGTQEIDVLCLARSVIRDLVHDWPERELVASPRDVCAALSKMIGDEYDFDRGDLKKGSES